MPFTVCYGNASNAIKGILEFDNIIQSSYMYNDSTSRVHYATAGVSIIKCLLPLIYKDTNSDPKHEQFGTFKSGDFTYLKDQGTFQVPQKC